MAVIMSQDVIRPDEIKTDILVSSESLIPTPCVSIDSHHYNTTAITPSTPKYHKATPPAIQTISPTQFSTSASSNGSSSNSAMSHIRRWTSSLSSSKKYEQESPSSTRPNTKGSAKRRTIGPISAPQPLTTPAPYACTPLPYFDSPASSVSVTSPLNMEASPRSPTKPATSCPELPTGARSSEFSVANTNTITYSTLGKNYRTSWKDRLFHPTGKKQDRCVSTSSNEDDDYDWSSQDCDVNSSNNLNATAASQTANRPKIRISAPLTQPILPDNQKTIPIISAPLMSPTDKLNGSDVFDPFKIVPKKKSDESRERSILDTLITRDAPDSEETMCVLSQEEPGSQSVLISNPSEKVNEDSDSIKPQSLTKVDQCSPSDNKDEALMDFASSKELGSNSTMPPPHSDRHKLGCDADEPYPLSAGEDTPKLRSSLRGGFNHQRRASDASSTCSTSSESSTESADSDSSESSESSQLSPISGASFFSSQPNIVSDPPKEPMLIKPIAIKIPANIPGRHCDEINDFYIAMWTAQFPVRWDIMNPMLLTQRQQSLQNQDQGQEPSKSSGASSAKELKPKRSFVSSLQSRIQSNKAQGGSNEINNGGGSPILEDSAAASARSTFCSPQATGTSSKQFEPIKPAPTVIIPKRTTGRKGLLHQQQQQLQAQLRQRPASQSELLVSPFSSNPMGQFEDQSLLNTEQGQILMHAQLLGARPRFATSTYTTVLNDQSELITKPLVAPSITEAKPPSNGPWPHTTMSPASAQSYGANSMQMSHYEQSSAMTLSEKSVGVNSAPAGLLTPPQSQLFRPSFAVPNSTGSLPSPPLGSIQIPVPYLFTSSPAPQMISYLPANTARVPSPSFSTSITSPSVHVQHPHHTFGYVGNHGQHNYRTNSGSRPSFNSSRQHPLQLKNSVKNTKAVAQYGLPSPPLSPTMDSQTSTGASGMADSVKAASVRASSVPSPRGPQASGGSIGGHTWVTRSVNEIRTRQSLDGTRNPSQKQQNQVKKKNGVTMEEEDVPLALVQRRISSEMLRSTV
ncbi:hypothetical protein BGZ80_007801 [Entomortierella chlamydospora]|uniref:Uncharacterized protein n=1 Tax=Entomortierella chlamydospora TaxID=101097 RepID=A0A9P6MXU4_9FUNG|nr:hypothetical protein BGZ80_007801 [Entomortierella chlamydospora]